MTEAEIKTMVENAASSAVAALKKDVIEPLKADFEKLTGKHDELAGNVNTIASTMAADKKTAEEAGKDAPGKNADVSAALTPEAINKQIAEGVAAQLKARDDAATAKAQDADAKAALRAKIVKEKFGGDEKLAASLPDTGDEAVLTKAADGLVATIKTYKPDFGGAAANGGTPPAVTPPATLNPNLSEGVAKYAAGIVLPK